MNRAVLTAVDEGVECEQDQRRPGPRCVPGAADEARGGQGATTRVP
jgi:hypothetical protein